MPMTKEQKQMVDEALRLEEELGEISRYVMLTPEEMEDEDYVLTELRYDMAKYNIIINSFTEEQEEFIYKRLENNMDYDDILHELISHYNHDKITSSFTQDEMNKIIEHATNNSEVGLNKVKQAWRDENNVLCVMYDNGNWYHYTAQDWY